MVLCQRSSAIVCSLSLLFRGSDEHYLRKPTLPVLLFSTFLICFFFRNSLGNYSKVSDLEDSFQYFNNDNYCICSKITGTVTVVFETCYTNLINLAILGTLH